jgi:PST family polysaccharide transporter
MVNNDAGQMAPGEIPGRKRGGLAGRAFYAGVDNWSQQGFQLLSFLYVGNVLGPEVVGVFASALLYHMLVSAFFVQSFSETIVQKKDITPEHRAAVFWFLVGLGFAMAAVSLLLARGVAAAFRRSEITEILYALAIIYPMLGASSFCVETLRRQLNFRWLALRTILSGSAAMSLAIVLVRNGYGVWSLVGYHVCWRTCDFAILLSVTDWRPRSRFSMDRFREVAHYGFHAMGLRLLAYVSAHLDKLIVGLLLGPAPLGIYMLGHRFVRALTQALTGVFHNVSLAVFSRLQSHRRVLGRAYSNATQMSNLVGFPVFVGLAVVAEPLVAALLKPEWMPLVPVLQIFCLGGILATVIYIQAAALRALGAVRIVFWGELALMSAKLCLLLIVGHLGLIPVAVTVSAFPLVALPLWQIFLDRRLNSGMLRFFANFLPAAWSCVAMAAVTLTVSAFIADDVSAAARLVVLIPIGAVTYFACLVATSPASIALIRTFRRMRVPQAS